MKKQIFLIFTTIVLSVIAAAIVAYVAFNLLGEKDREGVSMEYHLTQCADPFSGAGTSIAEVKQYFEEMDIEYYKITMSDDSAEVFCEACSCDSGKILNINFKTSTDMRRFMDILVEYQPDQDAQAEVSEYTFSRDDSDLFTLRFDSDFGIPEYQFNETREYIQLEDNDQNQASSKNYFTYFDNEMQMSYYFIPDTENEYEISYPLQDGDAELDQDYIYYRSDDTAYLGAFYDWERTEEVHSYQASTITTYTNYDGTSPYYGENSTNVNQYCVLSLTENIGPEVTGYLVFHGSRSIGTEENYCETLNSLDVFEIVR